MAEQSKIKRRTFFAALGGVAAVGVAAKVATQNPLPVVEAAPEPEGKGYRLSAHIKKYYRTTTI